MSHQWVHISKHADDALDYMSKRRTGEIKSLQTPWTKLNMELLNGLEVPSVIQLAGSSGTGKTLVKDQLTRGILEQNKNANLAVLDFQYEMLGRTGVMRDLSRVSGKDLKQLSSAFEPLPEYELIRLSTYTKEEYAELPIYIVDTPESVSEMHETVASFYKFHKGPFIATIDHSILVKKTVEKDEFAMIRNLATMLIETKKKYPIIWILLNQFNREFEDKDRRIPNSYAAFPTKSDIYGGDTPYFASDAVIAISRPSMYLTPGMFYGPAALNIRVSDELLVFHMLKNRVGDCNVALKMKSNFKEMKVEED